MGRVALELMGKSRPGKNGCLRILRKKGMSEVDIDQLQGGSLQGGRVLLNDPKAAREFLFCWEVG